MAIMLNARSNVYENIFFSASQPPDSSTISQIAGIAESCTLPTVHYPGTAANVCTGVGGKTPSIRDVRGREDHRTPGTRPHLCSAVLRPDTMNTTHDKCAGSGFDAEIGALAASIINSFDRLAAQFRDAGCSGGDDA